MPLNIELPLDINRDPTEIIMEHINVENNTELLASDFLFSAPMPATLLYSDINTKVTLNAKITSGYYGSRDVYYKRMDIVPIFNNEAVEVLIGTETLLSEIMPQINTLYGLNIQPNDYTDVTLPVQNPTDPDEPRIVTIAIKLDSYLFMGTAQFIIGRKVRPLDDSGVAREIYAIIKTEDTTIYQNNFIALDSQNQVSEYFQLMRNALNITKFRVDNFLVLSNKDICLRGEFGFDCAIGATALTTYDSKSIIISQLGNVKQATDTGYFGDLLNKLYFQNKNVDKIYYIDVNSTIGSNVSNLYRFNNDGSLDTAFTASDLNYVPTTVAICDDGKFYTTSNQYVDGSFNDPLVDCKKVRIDRFMPDGTVDLTFVSVILESSGSVDVTPVLQVLPVANRGAWIAVKSIHGLSTNGDYPLVNGIALVSVTDPENCAFNPIFGINEDGSFNTTFKSILPNNNPNSVCIDSADMKVGDKLLSFINNKITLLTNRVHPLTGYTHRTPICFDTSGNILNILPDRLKTDVKWENILSFVNLSNGNFHVAGTGSTAITSGGWRYSKSIIALYNGFGQLIDINYNPIYIGAFVPEVFQANVIETTS